MQPWQVLLDLSGPKKMQITDIYVSAPLHSANALYSERAVIPFMQSSTVLQPGTLEDFRKALTMLRLILPLKYALAIPREATPLADFLTTEGYL